MVRKPILLKLLTWHSESLAFLRTREADILKKKKFLLPLLDLGCGDGMFTSTIIKTATVGIDIIRENALLSKRTGVYEDLVVADASKLPFRRYSFHTVLSNCAIEHMHCEPVLNEIHRALLKKGRFVFTVPTNRFASMHLISRCLFFSKKLRKRWIFNYNKRITNFSTYSFEKWRRELGEAGFLVLENQHYFAPVTVLMFNLFSGGLFGYFTNKFSGKKTALLLYPLFKFFVLIDSRISGFSNGACLYIEAESV